MQNYEHEIIHDDSNLQLLFRPIHCANEYSPMHWHSHLEIIFLLSGYMTAYIHDKRYTLKKDDMLVINPKELHSTKAYGNTDYILLQIPYGYLPLPPGQISFLQFQAYFPSITTNATQKEMRNCLMLLLKIYEEKRNGYQLLFSSIMYRFLFILYKNYAKTASDLSQSKKSRNFERIEETIQYVKSNYQKEISLSDITARLNVSPEYFCRLFKKHTGQTFLEYVNAVRMIHFYQDLLHTDYSITELLNRNGITNYKVFIRMFKDTYKTTPHKLRKTLRQ